MHLKKKKCTSDLVSLPLVTTNYYAIFYKPVHGLLIERWFQCYNIGPYCRICHLTYYKRQKLITFDW